MNRANSKGIAAVVVIPLAGAVITLLAVLAVILPVLTLRVHFIETINYENNYNEAHLGLLTLLSATVSDTDKQTVGQLLTNYFIDKTTNTDPVKQKLDKLFGYTCYELKADDKLQLAKGGKCGAVGGASKYSASALIPIPNSEFKKITLVIG